MTNRKRFLIAFVILISSGLLCADFEITHWKYFKAIRFASFTSKQIISVPIDQEVISQSDSLERELRVIEGLAGEVPFNLVVDSDELHEDNRIQLTVLNKSVLEGKYQQFICDLGPKTPLANQVVLETSSHDFVRRADIEGSDDRLKWFSLARGLHIFDWSEGRKLKLEFPQSAYRFLKVVLWLDGGKPLEIQSVAVSRHEKHSGELEAVAATLHSQVLHTPQKFSEWIYDFGHSHPLVNRCAFHVTNPSFRRRVDLSASDDAAQWVPGPSLEIFRTTGGDIQDEFTELETNALNHRYLRIRMFNGDDRPLAVTGIHFRRFVRRVVFEFDPQKSYRLFYANASAQRPSYDLTAVESGSRLTFLPQGRLGPPQTNPDYVSPKDRQPWSERYPRLLWAVLIAVVLLLVVLIMKSVKSMVGKNEG